MNLLIIAFLLFVLNIKDLQAEQNSTEHGVQNKTKRTVSPAIIHNYGENKPLLYYNDNGGSSSDFSSLYMPVKTVFDSEIPKQVAAQQVLYEFQQTPTNAVSNVHVNQFYQPVSTLAQRQQSINQQQQQQHVQPTQTSSETVVNPVHHSTLIRHNQNLAPVQFQQPAIPHHVQTQQYIPGKYFYVNGKILYQPHQLNHPQQQQQQPIQLSRTPNYPLPQVPKQRILSSVSPLQAPSLLPRPFHHNNFNPPQQHHYQKITKPISTNGNNGGNSKNEEEIENDKIPVKEEDVEEEEEDEEEEDNVESSEADEESDDEDEIEDPRNFFHKYSFSDDEDEYDHHHEDDDDDDNREDNSRKPSKQVTKKHNNKSKSNKFNDHHHHYHHYKPSKTNKKKRQHNKSPKIKYQAMKYVRNGYSKPKIEYIEGKQSKHIPIVHKQKLFKEKWYVSKSTDDLAGA